VPVQAGDDDVLLRMRRGYSRDDFRRLIERVRARLPNASIATDVIVGFCGESESQFMRTHDLLEELKLDVIHLARYSTRPNTPAEKKLADDVPEDEKMRRLQFLEAQQERIVGAINAGYMNQTVQVLVEDMHKGKWRGRTPQNKLVFFEDAADWRGKLANVSINWTGPWSLRGTLVRAPADAPRVHALASA
jgi:tRNA-2-methylthio-N6-dimethylallyladenosine synthase